MWVKLSYSPFSGSQVSCRYEVQRRWGIPTAICVIQHNCSTRLNYALHIMAVGMSVHLLLTWEQKSSRKLEVGEKLTDGVDLQSKGLEMT